MIILNMSNNCSFNTSSLNLLTKEELIQALEKCQNNINIDTNNKIKEIEEIYNKQKSIYINLHKKLINEAKKVDKNRNNYYKYR